MAVKASAATMAAKGRLSPETLFKGGFGQAGLKVSHRPAPWSVWHDTAIIPLYAAIGAGCALCTYACSRNLNNHPDICWYKSRSPESKVGNLTNQASSYHEQRLFLANGRERSFRLGGGDMFGNGGMNMILGMKKAGNGRNGIE